MSLRWPRTLGLVINLRPTFLMLTYLPLMTADRRTGLTILNLLLQLYNHLVRKRLRAHHRRFILTRHLRPNLLIRRYLFFTNILTRLMILNLPPPTENTNFGLLIIGRLLPRKIIHALPLKKQDKI